MIVSDSKLAKNNTLYWNTYMNVKIENIKLSLKWFYL